MLFAVLRETYMDQDKHILPSVLDAIGHTPLVSLNRLTKECGGKIYAKLEYLNPGFSRKDRVARQMMLDARQDGSLQPGQTVIELTSGNTGTGLAIACAVLGHKFIAVMSRGNSPERARMMRAFGAEVVIVDQARGSVAGQVSGEDLALVEQETQRLTEELGAFRADQFNLPGHIDCHYHGTAQEILAQTGGAFEAFCDFVGSGGTFGGCARAFKEVNPRIQCLIVEPEGAAVLAGQPTTRPSHRIQGGGYSMRDLRAIDKRHIDGFLTVNDQDAIEGARLLARKEGIFAGFSAGANVAAALRLLRRTDSGQRIVIVIPDSGLKYLSTDLWPT